MPLQVWLPVPEALGASALRVHAFLHGALRAVAAAVVQLPTCACWAPNPVPSWALAQALPAGNEVAGNEVLAATGQHGSHGATSQQCPHAAPQLLQGFVTGDQGGPYSNMFEGWQPAGAVTGAEPAAAVPYASGMVQSTFLHPPAGAPGEMHFPAGWHAQRQQVRAFGSSLVVDTSVTYQRCNLPGSMQMLATLLLMSGQSPCPTMTQVRCRHRPFHN